MGKTHLIAIVDDDKTISQLLNELLTDEGYTTICCYSGKEAYAMIKKKQPSFLHIPVPFQELRTLF